jgi:mono/diheme cytochrome c family protein
MAFARKSLRSTFHGTVAAVALSMAAAAFAVPSANEHDEAMAALHDLRAAVAEIEHALDATEGGQAYFAKVGQRALNDLVGAADTRYLRAAGGTGDATGALGHLNRLLERSEGQPWTAAITGAQVNAQAALARLQSAIAEHGLDRFQLDATDALASLEMAVGRSSELTALGGLSGALATTVLGVPPGAPLVSACRHPTEVPAYGVAAGYLVYVALTTDHGAVSLPFDFGARRIEVDGNRVIVYTAAAELLPSLCERDRAAMAARSSDRGGYVRAASFGSERRLRGGLMYVAAQTQDSQPPRLYTEQQAQAGRKIYQAQCVSCHGKNLQGTAAPAVAGKDFLETAERNGWTLEDMRSIVFYNMPFSAPGSLSPDQYADLMAYLLAEDCYPAGDRPFPETDKPEFQNIPLKPLPSAQAAQGICTLK